MDLYALMEKEDRRHNRGACPVCNVELPLADIESHVNRCLDLALQSGDEQLAKSLARSGYHPLADGAPSSAERLPPKPTSSAEDHAYATLLLQALDTDIDFTQSALDDSAEQTVAAQAKPGGLALDMAALRRSQNAGADRGGQGADQRVSALDRAVAAAATRDDKGNGKQRLLVDDDDDDQTDTDTDGDDDDDDGDDGDDSDRDDKVELKIRLDTMSKRQIRKLCLKQHRTIERMRLRVELLEKDLKAVRVGNAVRVDDESQRAARDEWEAALQRQQQKASEREAERRRAAEEANEAKAIADALEAIKQQEEAEKAAAATEAAAREEEEVVERARKAAAEEWSFTGVEGNGLFSLPREVMLAVFANLAARDLANLSRVCRLLAEPAQDPLLWRQLFVSWLRWAKAKKWGLAADADILLRYAPAPPEASSRGQADVDIDDDSKRAWFLQFKKYYEKWRYATVTGNGERWLWDRCRNMLSGFSYCTRTHQKWAFDGARLRVVSGLFNYPTLEWSQSILRIQFRPQKAFQCREGVGVRDTFWNQDLWRFSPRTTTTQRDGKQQPAAGGATAEAEKELPGEVEREDQAFMATRIGVGGPGSLRAPYTVQGDIPLAIVALVLLQATGHL